jgi:hypothetical protein
MNDAGSNLMADEWALYRLAMLYSHAMDQNVPEIIDQIFTEDAVIETPSFTLRVAPRSARFRRCHAECMCRPRMPCTTRRSR